MSNRILSYKGLLADGGQDTILLSTKKGEVGYKIRKFELMGINENVDYETAVQIWKEFQTTLSANVDFSDNRLLGAALYGDGANQAYRPYRLITFDQEIFNQDIYITHESVSGASIAINYYLELEVIKLDESQAMVATLKDIRNNS